MLQLKRTRDSVTVFMLYVPALSNNLIETEIIYLFCFLFKLMLFSLWKHFDVTKHKKHALGHTASEVNVSEVSLRLTGDGAQG